MWCESRFRGARRSADCDVVTSPHVLRVRGASSQCQGAALYTVGLHHSSPLIEFLIGVGTRAWAVPVPPVGNCGESIFCLVMAVADSKLFFRRGACFIGGEPPEGLEVCNIPQGKGGEGSSPYQGNIL